MLCKLTQTHFSYKSTLKVGIHPEAFALSLTRVVRTLTRVIKDDEPLHVGHVFYLRLAVLLFLHNKVGLTFGSLVYEPEPEGYEFDPEELRGEIVLSLQMFAEPVPNLRKFKVKSIPCKRTVEFLQGCFYTYQEGMNYTPFKQYLETTLLSDRAVDAIVNYDLAPNASNFQMLRLAMMGQESMLLLSDKEIDFYNNRKLITIKRKLAEVSAFIPEDIINVNNLPAEDNQAGGDVPRTILKVKITPT